MPSMAKPRSQSKTQSKKQASQKAEQVQQHSWSVVRGFLQTCKHSSYSQTPNEEPKKIQKKPKETETTTKSNKKMKCSGSLCNNTKVMHRPDQSQQSPHIHANSKKSLSSSSSSSSSSTSLSASSSSMNIASSSSLSSSSNGNSSRSVNNEVTSSNKDTSSSNTSSFRGMPFGRFSGCYECRMVVDPVMGFVTRPTLSPCPDCSQIFLTPEALNHHRSLAHAVSELGSEDTSKNIVEIIFQSSWVQRGNHHQNPPAIHRILKVHNAHSTLSAFESHRDSVKSKSRSAAATATRCAADGNELLRFRAAAFSCSLGLNGSTALCGAKPCHACAVIRNGFGAGPGGAGILTTATSGRAHAAAGDDDGGERRAMLVCRVIAGRVKKGGSSESETEFDSVAGAAGVFSNLDELYVFNPKAILPCFVVIYSAS